MSYHKKSGMKGKGKHMAKVCDKAQVFAHAEVYGKSLICQKAMIFGSSHIFDRSCTFDNIS